MDVVVAVTGVEVSVGIGSVVGFSVGAGCVFVGVAVGVAEGPQAVRISAVRASAAAQSVR